MNLRTMMMATLLLTGCAGNAAMEGKAPAMDIQVGGTSAGTVPAVQAELERAFGAWGGDRTQLLQAVNTIEGIRARYRSDDGQFECRLDAVTALYLLELGERAEFLKTAARLEPCYSSRGRHPSEIEYVRALAAQFRGNPEGAGDSRLVRAIRELLK